MFIRFITSKLLRVIVCAAAGCTACTTPSPVLSPCIKRGISYLMAGAVRFDFQAIT